MTNNFTESLQLGWIDYLLFCVLFGFSALIGIYYGCFGSKQSSTTEYLRAGQKMRMFPIAVSLMASTLSGISLMGIPSEIYLYGTQYWSVCLAVVIMTPIISEIYLPVFYKLQLHSNFQYLKIRFDNTIRLFCSFCFIINTFTYLPIVIYVPSLAFQQVSGYDLYVVTPIISLICIFYTALGGLKGVVWTDTFQFCITLSTLLFVLFKGALAMGGFQQVWETAERGDRIEFFNMDIDPTVRSSFWSVVVASVAAYLSFNGVNPAITQRFLAVPSLSKARWALLTMSVGVIVTKSICCFSGLIMYAKYYNCDPLTSGKIKRADQILPYYVLDVAGEIPGLSGLFIAGVFSTALSTLSTFLNTLSGIIYTDFVKPAIRKLNQYEEEKVAKEDEVEATSGVLKLLVVITGCLCVGLVFVVEKLGNVLEMSLSLNGITAGPLLGLFTLGMLVPFANQKGAYWGSIGSLLFMIFVVVGNQWHIYNKTIQYELKPLDTSGCSSNHSSLFNNFATTAASHLHDHAGEYEPFWLFRVTFYYYPLLGVLCLFAIGVPVSWFTRHENDPVNPDVISPCMHRFLPKASYTSVQTALQQVISANNKELEAQNECIR